MRSFGIGQRPRIAARANKTVYGVHLCLGQILAKMEMRILWNELIPQLKSVRLAGETKLTESYFVNGLKHLPIEFEMV